MILDSSRRGNVNASIGSVGFNVVNPWIPSRPTDLPFPGAPANPRSEASRLETGSASIGNVVASLCSELSWVLLLEKEPN
jgi:hypothetical protein